MDILTRDRAEAYALARRTGAPATQQVADRFHLVHNVGEALKKLLRSQRWIVPEPETGATRGPPDSTLTKEPAPQVNLPKPTPRKQAIWEAVQQHKDQVQDSLEDYVREGARQMLAVVLEQEVNVYELTKYASCC